MELLDQSLGADRLPRLDVRADHQTQDVFLSFGQSFDHLVQSPVQGYADSQN
jgi:hypothetical protein